MPRTRYQLACVYVMYECVVNKNHNTNTIATDPVGTALALPRAAQTCRWSRGRTPGSHYKVACVYVMYGCFVVNKNTNTNTIVTHPVGRALALPRAAQTCR